MSRVPRTTPEEFSQWQYFDKTAYMVARYQEFVERLRRETGYDDVAEIAINDKLVWTDALDGGGCPPECKFCTAIDADQNDFSEEWYTWGQFPEGDDKTSWIENPDGSRWKLRVKRCSGYCRIRSWSRTGEKIADIDIPSREELLALSEELAYFADCYFEQDGWDGTGEAPPHDCVV